MAETKDQIRNSSPVFGIGNVVDQRHSNLIEPLLSAEPRHDRKGKDSVTSSLQNETSLLKSQNALFPSGSALPASISDCHEAVKTTLSSDQQTSTSSTEGLIPAQTVVPQELQETTRVTQVATARSKDVKALRSFPLPVEEAVERQFHVVKESLEIAIVKYLIAKRVEFRPLAIQLRVLGCTEEVAKPMIAVFCSEVARRKAERFLGKDRARDIYNGPETRKVRFECVVIGRLRTKANERVDEIFVEQLQPMDEGLWTPRIKLTTSGVSRFATLGGFVCVTDADGKESVYGLTVGHLLPPLSLYADTAHAFPTREKDYGSIGSESDSTDSETTSHSNNDVFEQDALDDPPLGEQSESSDDQLWHSLGYFSPESYSERARDRDWALVKIHGLTRPQIELSGTLALWRYEAAQAVGKEVVSIGNETGRNYIVSKLPARAVLPSGRGSAFVDMQVLDHTNEEDLPRGTSGSWIVGPRVNGTSHVYGVLVADDPFGSLWMVPILDILGDIKGELNVATVRLITYHEATLILQNDHKESDVSIKSFDLDSVTVSDDNDQSISSMTTLTEAMSDISLTSASAARIRRFEPGRHPLDAFPTSNQGLRFTRGLQPGAGSSVPRPVENSYRHSEKNSVIVPPPLGDSTVWFCEFCGDGPHGGWQLSCMSCSRVRGPGCYSEYDGYSK